MPEAHITELDFQQIIDRFDAILDAVERGERFCVLRNGRAIATMEPHLDRAPDPHGGTDSAA